MFDPPEIVHMYDCLKCSHQTTTLSQHYHHIQRKHNNVYAAELFHAIVEPEQNHCVCCDYKSYYQLKLYEHCKQAHNPRIGNNEIITFCEEFARYTCDCCEYESDSSLFLIKHNDPRENTPPSLPPDSLEEAECMDLPDPNRDENRDDAGTSQSARQKVEVSNAMFECNHCSYRGDKITSLKRHVRLKHDATNDIKWFQCNRCPYRTKQKRDLKKHVTLQHVTNKNWFQCIHCSAGYTLKSSLKRHVMLRHAVDTRFNKEINWFRCKKCSYRAKRKAQLKSHTLRHAADEDPNWLQCVRCPYRTEKKSDLKRHLMLQHVTNKNWFDCNFCPYKTEHRAALKRHLTRCASQQVTDKEKDWFECDLCSYRTKHESILRLHNLTHIIINKERRK